MIYVLENPLRLKSGYLLKPAELSYKNHFKIYALYHPITKEIRYIGLTSVSLKIRLFDHVSLRKSSEAHSYRYRWIKKLKSEGLQPGIQLLHLCYDFEELKQNEILYIKKYKTLGYRLVNSTDGGDGTLGYIPSEEVRVKIGSGMRGKKHSAETCKKMSASGKGKKFTEEHKRKIGQSKLGEKSCWFGVRGKNHPMYGTKWTEKQRTAHALAMVGRKPSKEVCEAHSERMKGEGNPFYGKNHSEETRVRMKAAWQKRREQKQLPAQINEQYNFKTELF